MFSDWHYRKNMDINISLNIIYVLACGFSPEVTAAQEVE
jgi:hypothetical protein